MFLSYLISLNPFENNLSKEQKEIPKSDEDIIGNMTKIKLHSNAYINHNFFARKKIKVKPDHTGPVFWEERNDPQQNG